MNSNQNPEKNADAKMRLDTDSYSDTYDIFLSYRRDGGETMAILLRDRLTARGYKVFLDIESLNSGTFNNKLFDVIDGCKDFVLICSKDSLERCSNDGDWVRLEIARALEKKKNIVPVLLRGFEFPDILPEDIEAVRMYNALNANSHEYFDAAIERLTQKFLVSPVPELPLTHKSRKTLLFAGAGIIALVFALILTIILIPDSKQQAESESDISPDINSDNEFIPNGNQQTESESGGSPNIIRDKIIIAGNWQLIEIRMTVYEDGEAIDTVLESAECAIEFKADGTYVSDGEHSLGNGRYEVNYDDNTLLFYENDNVTYSALAVCEISSETGNLLLAFDRFIDGVDDLVMEFEQANQEDISII